MYLSGKSLHPSLAGLAAMALFCCLIPRGGVLAAASPPEQDLLELSLLGADYQRALDDYNTRFSDEELRLALQSSNWRVRHQARVLDILGGSGPLYEQVFALEPVPTRAGFARFTDEMMLEPGAATVVLDRFLHGDDDIPTRLALLEVLSRSRADWSQALAELFTAVEEQELKLAIVAAMKTAAAPFADATLLLAMADPEPELRAEAARVAGWRKDPVQLAPSLIMLLQDPDPAVRAMAARSLGWHRVEEAWAPLTLCLRESSADLRLRAFQALKRIDRERLLAQPELEALVEDPDEAVSRAARNLVER